MNIRVLAPSEYSRLASIEEGFVPDPEASIAVCAFDGEEIVGRMLVVVMPHLMSVWVAPEKRGSTAGFRMEKVMVEELKRRGVSKVLAYVEDAKIDEYLNRLGYKREPYTVLSKEV